MIIKKRTDVFSLDSLAPLFNLFGQINHKFMIRKWNSNLKSTGNTFHYT